MMDATVTADLEIRNLVHQLAAQSWKDAAPPQTTVVEVPTLFTYTSHSHRLNTSSSSNFSTRTPTKMVTVTDPKRVIKSEPRSARRIQPVSIPRKPPDIQNMALFPPIGDEGSPTITDSLSKPQKRHSEGEIRSTGPSLGNNNAISSTELKLKQLESKLRGQVHEGVKPTQSSAKSRMRKSLESGTDSKNSGPSVINRLEVKKAPRSAELFAELSDEKRKEVDSIAEQYSSLIDNNLCRSVLEELTFLLKLISSCGGTTTVSLERIDQLSTVAEQVYFVIQVLSLQLESSLSAVDPKVIQLLVQKYPHRIPKHIRKDFEKWAASQAEKQDQLEPEDISTQKPSEYHQCVTFRSETDGRPNFPNQGDFHAFCKQRDLFYSIKNAWDEKEQTSFTESSESVRVLSSFNRNGKNGVSGREIDPLYPKIKALFNMNSSWGNLSHLAALFTSQYVLDSFQKRQGREDEAIKDEQMNSLLRSNPNRLAQLQNRMSTATIASHSTIGARSEDPLAFSKYFISVANSPAFNQHLIDRVTFEISQMESSLESLESSEPKEMEIMIRKSVLLAKLLGYLVFLPYRDEGPNNKGNQIAASIDKEALISKQIELRSYQRPPIDLKSRLVIAFQQKRLTFTLPWIVEFFAHADNVSLQLPAFRETISLICFIYRSFLKLKAPSNALPAVNLNFLRFWCGSLFTLEKFPDNLLYSRDEDVVRNELKLLLSDNASGTQRSQDDQDASLSLDLCGWVGDKLIRLYFTPHFNNMTGILHAGLQQQKTNIIGTTSTTPEVKHIRPLPAKSPVMSADLSKTVQLQLQLESSFFDSNSASVKRTVDFVADRIASNYVKLLRPRMSEERCKLAEHGIFEEAAATACRNIMNEQLKEFAENRCKESINILIGDSISPSALDICQRIASRKCTEKVHDWIANHIKADMFPAIEVPPPATGKAAQQEKPPVNDKTDSKPGFEAMISIHRSIKRLHQGKPLTEECLDEILMSKALLDEPALSSTIIDFSMALITFCPSLLTQGRQTLLVQMLRKHWSKEFKLFNPRNLRMMEDSRKWGDESWQVLTSVVKGLIHHKVLNLETLEQDCLSLLRQDCPSLLFSHLSHFLKELVSSFEVSTPRDQQSREILDWVAWYCSNDPE